MGYFPDNQKKISREKCAKKMLCMAAYTLTAQHNEY